MPFGMFAGVAVLARRPRPPSGVMRPRKRTSPRRWRRENRRPFRRWSASRNPRSREKRRWMDGELLRSAASIAASGVPRFRHPYPLRGVGPHPESNHRKTFFPLRASEIAPLVPVARFPSPLPSRWRAGGSAASLVGVRSRSRAHAVGVAVRCSPLAVGGPAVAAAPREHGSRPPSRPREPAGTCRPVPLVVAATSQPRNVAAPPRPLSAGPSRLAPAVGVAGGWVGAVGGWVGWVAVPCRPAQRWVPLRAARPVAPVTPLPLVVGHPFQPLTLLVLHEVLEHLSVEKLREIVLEQLPERATPTCGLVYGPEQVGGVRLHDDP